MIDAKTASQVENFNTDRNKRLDDTKFRIQHGEGGFTLEEEYDLQQWDPSYGDNEPTVEEYGAANGGTPLAGAEYLKDYRYDKNIGAKIIINKKSNNSGNLATVIRRSTDKYGSPIGKAHRKPMLDTLEFEVELEDGETDKIMSNQIAANLPHNWTMRAVRYCNSKASSTIRRMGLI